MKSSYAIDFEYNPDDPKNKAALEEAIAKDKATKNAIIKNSPPVNSPESPVIKIEVDQLKLNEAIEAYLSLPIIWNEAEQVLVSNQHELDHELTAPPAEPEKPRPKRRYRV